MKCNNNHTTKLLALALAIVMALSLTMSARAEASESASIDSYSSLSAADKLSGGFDESVVVVDRITLDEYSDSKDENDLKNIYNSLTPADDFWRQFSTPYYKYEASTLTSAQIELYDRLYASLYGMIDGGVDCEESLGDQYLTPALTFSGLSDDDAAYVGQLMLYEHPELYFLKTIVKIDSVEDSDDKTIQLGVYGKMRLGSDRSEYAAKLQERIIWYLERIDAETDYDKQVQIHDLICENTTYDSKTDFTQSVASLFLDSKSVCAGYSEAFTMLCNASSIAAISVTSSDHEWSEVKLGDYWYAVDVTWDDSGDETTHLFLDVSDATLRGHSEYSSAMHTVEDEPWAYVGRAKCPYDYGKEDAGDIVEPEVQVPTCDVYRLYNSTTGEHFYTTSYAEVMTLIDCGWAYEGIAWNSPETSSVPVYRLYNPNSMEHFYTISSDERDILVTAGWSYEAISWYSDPNGLVALHRMYNPNATGIYEAGAHHYTQSFDECMHLAELGWVYEGVSFYAV